MKSEHERYIDALLLILGLSDIVQPFNSVIEIDPYGLGSDRKHPWDGYAVLYAIATATPAQHAEAKLLITDMEAT